MRHHLCTLLSLSALAGAQAGTAYDALKVIGKQRGDATLDRVIEVRGSKGAPQPKAWKVVVLDEKAPSGVREFDVQGTSIGGEKTPQPVGSGDAMNMSQLNLDSDGAHTVAEREAKKKGFAYDYVSYLLHGASKGSPVWELRLVDEQNGNTAILTMAADTGKLLNTEGLDKGSAPVGKVVENRRVTRRDDSIPPDDDDVPVAREDMERGPARDDRRREEVRRDGEHFGNKVTGFFDRAGRHIGGAFQRFGEKVDRAFTGNPPPRRVERRAAPTPAPSSSRITRDANGTEYYRPRD